MEDLKGHINKAIIYAEPGTTKTEVVEQQIPEPGPGQVLVRLLFSGVCHTDYSICTHSWKFVPMPPAGQVGGHEGVGRVVALGSRANGAGGPGTARIGAYVGIKYGGSACLSCRYCLQGAETSCVAATISGLNAPGTFQQYVLAPANYVTPIPESVVQESDGGGAEGVLAGYAPLMCAGVTVYTAIKRSRPKVGDWVLVTGAGGGLGHLAVQYAKAAGCRVVGVDVASKERIAKECGVDAFVDFAKFGSDQELVEHVRAATGGGVNVALVCSSSSKAYEQAVEMLDFRGVLVCMGVPEGEDAVLQGAKVGAMVRKELTIVGVKPGNRLDCIEAVEVAASGKVKTTYQLRKMDELTEVFEEMKRGEIGGRVVIDLR